MDQDINAVMDLLLNIYDKIERTQEEALLKGYFSDLTKSEMNTLDHIGPYDERTMGETAGLLGITTGTLTVAVDRLVKKGYVQRKRPEHDRRIVLLSLTRKGKLACRMYRKFHRLLVQEVRTQMDDVSDAVFIRMLNVINQYLNDLYIALKEREKKHGHDIR